MVVTIHGHSPCAKRFLLNLSLHLHIGPGGVGGTQLWLLLGPAQEGEMRHSRHTSGTADLQAGEHCPPRPASCILAGIVRSSYKAAEKPQAFSALQCYET